MTKLPILYIPVENVFKVGLPVFISLLKYKQRIALRVFS